jgi:hypothetical protein
MFSTIVIVLLILLFLGALPTWPYSASWGYAPGGLLGTVLVVVLILALLGRIEKKPWSVSRSSALAQHFLLSASGRTTAIATGTNIFRPT